VRIDSSSDRGAHILAVQIPLHACGKCREIGRQWYDEADPRKYTRVFLQNRPDDEYLTKNLP
jgi:hypothetical protein